jgi:NAD(P)-dependent dehydrogenase (short-subunit alcohol dehydrogenase family)
VYSPLVDVLRERGFEIEQMPCPELAFTGLNRFWAVREQLDTLAYRRHCDRIASAVAGAIEARVARGDDVVAMAASGILAAVTRSAIVTGGASGIGRAVAQRLAADGFHVLVADVRRDPLSGGEPTDALITAAGGAAEYVAADVSSRADCEALVARAVERCGALDVLVNNAVLAGAHSKPLLETEDEDWDAMMAVNLRGPFLLCRAAVRQMLGQPLRGDARGRIVNITSQHGMVGVPGHFAYAVGKGGLVQLTRQVAVEHGRDGVLCNAVAPGKIVTGAEGDLTADETSLAYVRSRTPFSRLGRPDDVASAVAFLASDAATYVSGASLLVDGGWMAY